MPTVRQRATAAKTTTRRRDRAAEEPDETDEDEVETTSRPAPARKKAAPTRVRRTPAPVEDEDDEDEWEDDEADEAEDEEAEAPAPRRRAPAKGTTARRRPAPEPEDDEEDEDEEPAPRRSAAKRTSTTTKRRSTRAAESEDEDEDDEEEAPPSRRRRTTSAKATTRKKGALPEGVKTGWGGVEALRKERGSGAVRLDVTKDPELIKFLEPGPLVTYAQHWVSEGGKGGNRPYKCPITDCPLCAAGDRANQVVVFNVLHLSDEEGPKNKILNLGVRAAEALEDAATFKKGGTPDIERDFFTVSKSGQKGSSQTNFRPIHLDDILDDWEEVLDTIDIDNIDAVIEEAQTEMFDITIVQQTSRKQLLELARYLSDDDD